jgi:outer membrane protein OmpA-like peptidoglycan-associated protein
MKKILLLWLPLAFYFAQGQLTKKIADKAKNKAESTGQNKTNEIVADAKNKNTNDHQYPVPKDTPVNPPQDTNQPVSFKTYSKYDFVPGEKVIGFEDFSNGNIGDFPVGWNTTASGEIVTIEGIPGRWLWFTSRGEFAPGFPQPFPEDFTFEFDLLHGIPIDGGGFTVCIAELANKNQPQYWAMSSNNFTIELNTANTGTENGNTRFIGRKNSSSDIQNSAETNYLTDKNNPVHVSIWRQKERVRVYVNDKKIWDIPQATIKDAKFNSIVFSVIYAEEVVKHYISNLRLAVGAPETRKKMLEQNKWVTRGIMFDVNSANIKPESYGTLKEMANVLKEFPDLKVKIVGHTDTDGNDASNLDLSKRRAASVKVALSKEFSIDESRMQTDGKGESEPIDKNDTPAGKANNRRVEFIKI